MNQPIQSARRRTTWTEALVITVLTAGLALVPASLLIGLLHLLGLQSPAQWPGLVVLTGMLFALGLIPARRVGPALIARYDGDVMRVEAPTSTAAIRPENIEPRATDPATTDLQTLAPGDSHSQADWHRLQAWCFAGAGSGRSPLWQPWVAPQVEQRFTVGSFAGGMAAHDTGLIERFSRYLDGSTQLDTAGGGLARLLLRLRVKRNDCMWWRERQATDPWDCGYLAPQPATLQHLRHFRPRRATLLLAHELPATDLAACIATLNANCHDFHHPVRLLVLGSAAPGNPDVAPLDVDPVSARSPDRVSGNGLASHDDWHSITPRQETP
ncbi:MAG: hypothetical protein Q7J47_15605 [Azoarcus sp.]|nr:hypothetical protein [Azoarcus sp.]